MKAIDVITIPVSDQQKAKEFYLKLGFQVMIEAPMGNGETWIQLGLPNQTTSIALMTFHSIVFETEDIEKEIQELKTKGIGTGNIDNTPWGKFVQVKDLDGNSLTYYQK
jgi:catechol 2,3-dioxygenase-like lactoylglutathione lyase family enzyme